MSAANHPVKIALRIPGAWAHPGQLQERLPEGYQLTPDALVLPDGAEIEFIPMPPDDQFAGIFEQSCRRPVRSEELEIVGRYSVNVGLTGPGGSLAAARTMMQAASAIVRAGGAGVFIDNCAMAFGGADWIEMADDGSPDALSFAFVSLVRNRQTVYTMGMHALGFADLKMNTADIDEKGEMIIDLIRYVCSSGRPIGVGHVLADEHGPRFQIVSKVGDEFSPESCLHNPFGCLKIVNSKDIAAGN